MQIVLYFKNLAYKMKNIELAHLHNRQIIIYRTYTLILHSHKYIELTCTFGDSNVALHACNCGESMNYLPQAWLQYA